MLTPLNYVIVAILSRSCTIAADCLAIGVTWFTLSSRNDFFRSSAIKGSMSSVLLMDGAYWLECTRDAALT